jgi:hypothetical protein
MKICKNDVNVNQMRYCTYFTIDFCRLQVQPSQVRNEANVPPSVGGIADHFPTDGGVPNAAGSIFSPILTLGWVSFLYMGMNGESAPTRGGIAVRCAM